MVATGFKSPPPTPGLFSSSPYPGSRSSSIDPMLHNKAGRNLLSPPSGLLDDAALADVKVHYCSQVYEAVLVAIRRSLHALISTIDWRHLEINRYRSINHNAFIKLILLPSWTMWVHLCHFLLSSSPRPPYFFFNHRTGSFIHSTISY